MSNKKFDPFRRLEELPSRVYIILGILCLAIHVILCTYTDISVAVCGLILIGIYIVSALIITMVVHKRINIFRNASNYSEEQNNGVIYTFRHLLKIPYAVVTEKGKIITVNAAMKNAAGAAATVFNADIKDSCGISMDAVIKHMSAKVIDDEDDEEDAEEIGILKDKTLMCKIGDKFYHIDCHPLFSKGKMFYLLMFRDITELKELSETHRALHTAVAYIIIDNLDEIAQYAQVSYQAEVAKVDSILKDWAKELGGIIREYDRHKYVLMLTRQSLLTCVKNKFEILDKVRQITLGDDNMPITVSIGVTTLGTTLAERERESLVCLEMALQRGGDQAVIKNETGTFFFGGRTKSQQKRSGGHSRVISTKLCSMISSSSNVIVMGHSNPDFDSIGACVGIAALCMHLGVRVKIVTNLNSENFKACTGRLTDLADYRDIFVDDVTGLDESEFGTLLIVVDANNFRILEAPEIAANSFKTAVIDHHIKKEEFEQEPQLVYIDPSASSACELISEILEFSIPVGTLRKEEANVLMAGIMVDTQNFTRTVGTRTFAAALYLRSAGASTEYARTFFDQAFEDYHSEAIFGTNAEIYGDQIAITASEGTGSPNDRVAAAKAADKLLAVKNVNAAFALVAIGTTVHISGRSNGKLNVQLILEKIGGGGHFDVAGAALTESSLDAAKEMLIKAIDEYVKESSSEK
ncbi:MAG: hypothetical protein E7677_03800 [Ruminococcaceae bacterium]|nr:hypothetical protein [Oscillospiraceae bacterium]